MFRKVMVRICSQLPYRLQKKLYDLWLRISPEGAASGGGDRIVVKSWEAIKEIKSLVYTLEAHRYYWIAEKVKNKTVLDLGCGSGYGSYYLSQFADSVVGVDKDPEAIKWANKYFNRQNITFQVGDALNLNFPPDAFDVVVCVEVLEHVYRRDSHGNKVWAGEDLFKQIQSICRHWAYITTPNINSVRVDELKLVGCWGQCEHHIKELTVGELRELGNKYFPHCNFFGQHIKGVKTLDDWMKARKRAITLSDIEMLDLTDPVSEELVNCCSNIVMVCECTSEMVLNMGVFDEQCLS